MNVEQSAPGSATPETTLPASETVSAETQVQQQETATPAEGAATPETTTSESDAAKVSEAAKTLSEAKQRKAEQSRERWNNMQRERFEAQARADKAEKALAELQAKLKPPVPGDYEDNAKYTADMVQHTLDKNEVARRQDEITSQRQQAEELKARQWVEKAEAAKEKYPDFDAKVGAANLPITQAMADAIVASPMGADVAYELASNPSEAARIARMSPVEQYMEIGVVAARLSTSPPKKFTQAPAPFKSVSGSPSSSRSIDDMTMEEYAAYTAEERKRK